MNIKNPPFRLFIYGSTAAAGTLLVLWLGISGLIADELLIPFLLCSFVLFLSAQYLTSFLMEEFLMEVKGNQIGRWLSAPLGIMFCFLTYSIISLSIGLLA